MGREIALAARAIGHKSIPKEIEEGKMIELKLNKDCLMEFMGAYIIEFRQLNAGKTQS